MGAKKKQKLLSAAVDDLNAGLQAILHDASLSTEERASSAGRALRQPGLPSGVCRAAVDWLLVQSDPAVGATLRDCLSTPGVQCAVDAEPKMLDKVLLSAAGVSGGSDGAGRDVRDEGGRSTGGGASRGEAVTLDLSAFPAELLISPAASAANQALASSSSTNLSNSHNVTDSNDVTDSTDITDSRSVSLFRCLCSRLSSVADPSESLRATYLAELLLPSLRLASARPDLTDTVRGPFEAIALGSDGLAGLTAAAGEGHKAPEGPAQQLLNALQNLSATEPSLGVELLGLLAGRLLKEKTPLNVITLLARSVGIATEALDETQKTPQKSTPSELETDLPLSTRLLILGRLARCIREARLPLTSASGGQTLLQWLRAAAASAEYSASSAASYRDADTAAAWFDCAAELMRVTPLVLPLQGRLGAVLLEAIEESHGEEGPASATATRLVSLIMSTYSELRQLPRLLPRLLLAARQLSSTSTPSPASTHTPKKRKHHEEEAGEARKRRRLRLTPAQEAQLAELVARLPQQHVQDVWKTLLYHLTEDGAARMARGEESEDLISPVLELTLQLLSVFLGHAAVIDQTTVTAATRALLAGLMTQTAETLQQVAAQVTKTYRSPGHVSGLLSAALSWRRLHSALLHYCPAYRSEMTSEDAGMTSPLAPLGEKRWTKLVKLEAATEAECQTLVTEFVSEAARVAPPDWQPPAAAGARAGRPLSGPALLPLSPSQLGALLPSGAEQRPLPLAVAVLLADRLATALPPSDGKRKLECGRPPQQLAAALRAAAAAALERMDATVKMPQPMPEDVLEILEEVGAALQADAERWSSTNGSSEAEDVKSGKSSASLTRPLQLVLALPLEHVSELAASLLLPLLCLCLLHSPSGGRVRELALSALTALLVSTGCSRPLETIQPGRLLTWLAATPPSLPSSHTLSTDSDGSESMDEDETTSKSHTDSKHTNGTVSSPKPRRKSTTSVPNGCAGEVAGSTPGAGCTLARRAVLRCYPGRRCARLGPVAEQLAARLQDGSAGEGALDTLVEMLQHFVQANTSLKGSDSAVKEQAKSLSASLPRLLCALPSAGRRLTLSSLALLVPLRAHKPTAAGGRPPRWRRLLAEMFPVALEAARSKEEEVERKRESEVEERVTEEGEQGAAWELLTAVCAAREHLKSDLPPGYVLDVWRCARSSDVTVDQLRTVLSAADDAEIEQMVTELTDETTSLPVSPSAAALWRRLLSAWRALAGCTQLSTAGRAQQRRGLTRLLARLADTLVREPAALVGPGESVGAEGQRLRVEVVETVTAAVAQKHVRLSDTAYADGVQCCHLDLSSLTTLEACEVLRTVCELIYQLVGTHQAVISTRLPLITQAVQSVADEVCQRAAQQKRPSSDEVAALVATANRMTRAVRELVQLGPLSEPLAPYLIADLLTLIQREPIDAEVQEALTASLFCLLTQCRKEVITRLRVTLPATVTHLFHTTVSTYKKFHKFVGRV
ncbi:uncharacterized protein LOC122365117 isoform X2 [Amphibalanus amphitrite]|nr:uncharacterized protein LOC122365117 isoform X2 [Amphibalanus amphitrite]XP_043192010.1 uncharacterized protein LOC122365117 isoform X2 [Amphibalanus amphitrite]